MSIFYLFLGEIMLAFCHGGLGSIPFTWNLWWKKWHCDRISSCRKVKLKAKLSCNKSWTLGGGVEMLDFQPYSDIRHAGWHSCQLYMPTTVYPQGNSLVLISITRLSGPQSYSIQALGIDHLKISMDPTRNRSHNLIILVINQLSAQILVL